MVVFAKKIISTKITLESRIILYPRLLNSYPGHQTPPIINIDHNVQSPYSLPLPPAIRDS